MGFGQTLREAREAKGYSVAQLAEMTHIMARTIEGLEAEDFSGIAAPIYGRGFVKLCCQSLDLDPKTMVDEFMAIYNGEKPAVVRPPLPPVPEPIPEPEPEPVSPPVVESVQIPAPEPEPAVESVGEPIPSPVAEPVPATENPPYADLFNQTIEPARAKTSRFAPPQPQDDAPAAKPFALPAIPWRLILLLGGAIAVIWALVAGCRAIYRALGSDDATAEVQPATTAPARPSAEIPPAKVPRNPRPVRPLYID